MRPDSTALVQLSVSPEREIIREFGRLIGSQTFDHWFRDKASVEIAAGYVTIGVANAFLLSWMQKRYRAQAAEAARHVLGESVDVRFKVRAADPSANSSRAVNTREVLCARPGSEPQRRTNPQERSASETRQASVPIQAGEAARQLISPRRPVVQGATGSRPPSPTPPSTAPSGRRFADLADFVKGACNELALMAALQVCDEPGTRYNPLVLHGGVGTGKTHLLEAIHRRLRGRYPALNVLLISAETFANCFTQALRDRTLPSFRQRFRTVDVLMVDDVDFLDGKRVIQEEFLHTIKQLESHQRQIALSTDRHPRLLTKLSEELVTRFISGIVCRIETPDLETRRTIVARKAARLGASISEETLEFVAQRFPASVRELEGAINCLETYAAMTGKAVGLSTARHVLADLHRDCTRMVRLPDVEQTVCRFFGVGIEEIRSPRRTRSVSQPRMLAMYLARKMTQAAYSEIGEYFGGRNHSTVISAEKRVRELLAAETTVRVAAQTWKLGDLISSLEQQLLVG